MATHILRIRLLSSFLLDPLARTQIEGLAGSQTPSNNDLPVGGLSASMFRSKGFWKQSGLLIMVLHSDEVNLSLESTDTVCRVLHGHAGLFCAT
jgi:hypothetical protein